MINSDGTAARRAQINKTTYRLIRTERGEGNQVFQATDTIRNESTGKDLTKKRIDWYNIFKNKNWIELPEK